MESPLDLFKRADKLPLRASALSSERPCAANSDPTTDNKSCRPAHTSHGRASVSLPEGSDSSQGTEITQCARAASAGSSASSATKMQNRSSPLTDEAKVFSLQAIYSNLILVFNTSLMFWVLCRESLWIILYICIIKGQTFFPDNSRSSSRVAFSLARENGKDKFAS